MKSLAVLMIFLNGVDGSQTTVYQSEPQDISICDKSQREIWSGDWPIVDSDEFGDVPMIDAACVPVE